MVAYSYRMPAGIPGEVNRLWAGTTIEPNAFESPYPAAYGDAVFLDTATGFVRAVQPGDTTIYGWLCRPYPFQSPTSAGAYGGQPLATPVAPPNGGVHDILRRGYMTVLLGGTAAVKKGGTVYVWIAASTGTHYQGQPEGAATGGSTIALGATTQFQGPADASGNVEISFNI